MVRKKEGRFYCSICNKEFPHSSYATACEKSHEMIYVAFYREDLFKLIQFIMTGDMDLLSKRLVDTLYKYKSGEYK